MLPCLKCGHDSDVFVVLFSIVRYSSKYPYRIVKLHFWQMGFDRDVKAVDITHFVQNLINCLELVGAVSYTHLDVYKRQCFN